MGLALLWILHLTFSLLLAAAALAWGGGRGALARRLVVALAVVPLALLHGRLAWMALAQRFDLGIAHAPWLYAVGLAAGHLLGAGVLVVRARKPGGATAWPAGVLALAALVALALDLTTLWNLELRARLLVADLRFEAGRIAWRESPPRPTSDQNAAPTYVRAAERLAAGGEDHALGSWSAVVDGEAQLDAGDPALRGLLERCAPALEEVRAAARLPRCWFEPEPGPLGEDRLVAIPKVLPLLTLSNALALEARVRAADGEPARALGDVQALFRLSAHVAQTPVLSSTMAAAVLRRVAVTTLAHVLSAGGLEASELAGFELRSGPPLVSLAPGVVAMEQAWGLSAAGLLGRADVGMIDAPWLDAGGRLNAALYKVFLLEDDLAGYRETMGEQLALARAPLGELLEAGPLDEQAIRRRGLLATLMTSQYPRYLLELHRVDARVELARLALDAARFRLEHGRYPSSVEELDGAETGVELAGDGSWMRLTRPDLVDGGEPLALRLPATGGG